MSRIKQEDLLSYLRDEQYVEIEGIDGATPLFSSGLIDSFALVEMMTFIEDKAGVRVEPADITLENVDTIQLILQFVERMAAEQAG
jgi:acyl carrier protein